MAEDFRMDFMVKEKLAHITEENEEKVPTTCPTSYKAWKKWFYFLLERPSSTFAVFYHFTSLMLILGSLLVSVLSTVKELEDQLLNVMFYYELFLLIWFSVEFTLRLWSCSYISRYQGTRGRMRFLFSIYMLIDIFVILSTITTFLMQINGSYFAILRVTRFMQVFRILRIDRQRGDFRTMGNVVKEHSKELITVYFVGFVIMFAATYIVYLCEKHSEMVNSVLPDSQDNATAEIMIDNMANGLYWAVITVTSVGYGDLSPVTWVGKIFCAIFALIGCAFFSLPAGILGSGFALQVAKQKKKEHSLKVRDPAARVIQTFWRNYAIHKDHDWLTESWYSLIPQLKGKDKTSAKNQSLEMLMRTELDKSQHLGSMFPPVFKESGLKDGSELKTHSEINNPLEEGIKKLGKIIARKNSETLSMTGTQDFRLENMMIPNYQMNSNNNNGSAKISRRDLKRSFRRDSNNGVKNGGVVREMIHQQIQERYKIAVRFCMKLRYCCVVRKYKSKRHPYVNMQDIIEKNSASHVEVIGQIKSMKDSFNILHQELLELRYALIELKQEQGKSPEDGNNEKGRMTSSSSNPSLLTATKPVMKSSRSTTN